MTKGNDYFDGILKWNASKWAEHFSTFSNSIRESGEMMDNIPSYLGRSALRRVVEVASNAIKELRSNVFRHTVNIAINGRYQAEDGSWCNIYDYDIKKMYDGTRIYSEEFSVDDIPAQYETIVEVESIDCLKAARLLQEKGYNVAVLNMASRRHPGGGVYSGAGAQEENLFRRTNLFQSMYQYSEYASQYGVKRSTYQYPLDRNFGGVYVPEAYVLRGMENDGYPVLCGESSDVVSDYKRFKMSFISVPGMNRPELKTDELIVDSLVEPIKNKIRTIFRIGLAHGHDALVLGALGCGAYRNPPKHISKLFHEVMEESEFKNKYKMLFFAILEDHNSMHRHNSEGNYKPFYDEFMGNKSHDENLLHRAWFYDGLTWSLYSDGTLEISGSGRMPDYINHWDSYFGEEQAPWIGCERYGVMPYKLRISNGITYVGANAFESFGCLKEVELADSVHELGKMAFFDCFHIQKINVPRGMNMEQFDVAELPMYYNNEYVIQGNMLISKN